MKYLGVWFSNDLSWDKQVESVTAKVSSTFSFITRNFKKAPRNVREILYFINIRPRLKHACIAWDMHTRQIIKKWNESKTMPHNLRVEISVFISVSNIKEKLRWRPPQSRRNVSGFPFQWIFAKKNLTYTKIITCCHHSSFHLELITLKNNSKFKCRTNALRFSYFPKSITKWYSLPEDVLTAPTNVKFQKNVK